jgi:hypothetical protein
VLGARDAQILRALVRRGEQTTDATCDGVLRQRRIGEPSELLEARSGGEGEVGALGIGTYGFARSVDEITVRPRPASPGSTIITRLWDSAVVWSRSIASVATATAESKPKV